MALMSYKLEPAWRRAAGAPLIRQVLKSDRINSDRQSGSDQLGSTRIVSDHEKKT